MLWFAMATDPATERQAPTWYVGKAEEFGQARGWLQVRSAADLEAGRSQRELLVHVGWFESACPICHWCCAAVA